LNVGAWARTHDLRLTCPPPYPLSYCVKDYEEKISIKSKLYILTRMRGESTRMRVESTRSTVEIF
jgi:hypothetical protein